MGALAASKRHAAVKTLLLVGSPYRERSCSSSVMTVVRLLLTYADTLSH